MSRARLLDAARWRARFGEGAEWRHALECSHIADEWAAELRAERRGRMAAHLERTALRWAHRARALAGGSR